MPPAARWAVLLGASLAWRLVLFIGPVGSDNLFHSDLAQALAGVALTFGIAK